MNDKKIEVNKNPKYDDLDKVVARFQNESFCVHEFDFLCKKMNILATKELIMGYMHYRKIDGFLIAGNKKTCDKWHRPHMTYNLNPNFMEDMEKKAKEKKPRGRPPLNKESDTVIPEEIKTPETEPDKDSAIPIYHPLILSDKAKEAMMNEFKKTQQAIIDEAIKRIHGVLDEIEESRREPEKTPDENKQSKKIIVKRMCPHCHEEIEL